MRGFDFIMVLHRTRRIVCHINEEVPRLNCYIQRIKTAGTLLKRDESILL